ncbi:TlpA disulfide reductase family protein [Chitinophaga sp. XS-30]|uniref:TlpA family protein disulfide reductase n=1 Tax=Chitinophaga sp. XS-30 TaxID=2604421 RepID=UPI0011DE03DF|nr:TlpA disulfide reductase family protein [Chitinophaga sp. XS-30]QEH41928.1 redoxin family protein [Chitinophaga sp. XS-30]
MLLQKMKLTRAILLFLWPVAACAQSGLPVLQAGTVSISGEVAIPETMKKDSVWLLLVIPQPFTGENKQYKTLLDPDGRFALKVNTETDISRCAVGTDINMENLITVLLANGRDSKITFSYSDDGIIDKVKTSDDAGFTEEDLILSLNKFNEMIGYRSDKPIERLYDKPFSVFLDHTNSILQERRAILNKPPLLSEKMNEIIFKDYLLAMYYGYIFNYHDKMVLNYSNTNNRKRPDSSEIKKPGREYYSFLKDLDLNNQLHLYGFSYPDFTQELLENNILNIPRIQDTPIREWTEEVKDILEDLIGSDQGLFYDILIGNAYAMQFGTELEPLTTKQIENIKNYYKGGELEKILLRKNQDIKQLALAKEAVVVNNTPDVSPEELMSTIISKYKGKTVIVDFWATWCGPCLEAIKASRDIKKQLVDKDAVFIYISSPSSPRELWERHIQGIGGEQYYLSAEEWRYVLDSFDFSAIPTYLIFDKEGVLKQQFTGYPGNEEMQRRIEAVLEGDLISHKKQ